jgi:hypothetical protein
LMLALTDYPVSEVLSSRHSLYCSVRRDDRAL